MAKNVLGQSSELLVKQFTSPGAGNEISIQVPSDRWWRFVSGHATFATSATVATRQISWHVQIGSSGGLGPNEYWAEVMGQTVTASQGIEVLFDSRRPLGPTNVVMTGGLIAQLFLFSLPTFWLPPGALLATGTTALQAADSYTNVQFLISELSGASAGASPLFG